MHFGEFFRLGLHHIFSGYDHLLFLLGLLVASRRLKSVVLIVTCFTLAHSLTLALSVIDVVRMPERLVELAIAGSILFVGVENLLMREEPRWRWAVTILFGLMHGFGFAGILRETLAVQQSVAIGWPLLAFNLGVECGGLLLIVAAWPALGRLRRERPEVARRTERVVSVLVAASGFYWLIERSFLS